MSEFWLFISFDLNQNYLGRIITFYILIIVFKCNYNFNGIFEVNFDFLRVKSVEIMTKSNLIKDLIISYYDLVS